MEKQAAADDGIISDPDYSSITFSLRSLDLHYDDLWAQHHFDLVCLLILFSVDCPRNTKFVHQGLLIGQSKLMQLIMLIAMIVFVVWTSTGHRIVPNSLATLYIGHLQSTITAITLFGSLLSLVNIK